MLSEHTLLANTWNRLFWMNMVYVQLLLQASQGSKRDDVQIKSVVSSDAYGIEVEKRLMIVCHRQL